jgi:hypothetical protein
MEAGQSPMMIPLRSPHTGIAFSSAGRIQGIAVVDCCAMAIPNLDIIIQSVNNIFKT